jgi:hypothetical protein
MVASAAQQGETLVMDEEEETNVLDFLDEILDDTDDNPTLAVALNVPRVVAIINGAEVSKLHFANDMFNHDMSFPNGISNDQFNLIVIPIPRKEDKFFSISACFNEQGQYDGKVWETKFQNWRDMNGQQLNGNGQVVKKKFSWIELGFMFHPVLIPTAKEAAHQYAMETLAEASSNTVAVLKGGKNGILKARVCSPFTFNFVQLMSSPEVTATINARRAPVILFSRMFFQKYNGGYYLSTQTGNRPSQLRFVGAISMDEFFPIEN